MIHFTNGKTDHNLKPTTFEEIAETIISEFYAKVEKDNRKQFIIGEYKNSYWNLGNFIQSEYIILDIDHCGNERATQIRNDLKENKNIFFASISTSKDGLKIMLKLSEPVKDFETLKTVHNYYAKEIEKKYKVKVDRMPFSIISSFFLADKDAFYNPKCNTVKPYRLELSKSDEKKTISKTGKTKEFNPESFFNTQKTIMKNLDKNIDWKEGALISLSDGTGIIYEGTINTLEGVSGSNKSHLCEAFITALIKQSNDILGLSITRKPLNIVLIDSERHKETQFVYAIQSIRQNAGNLPDNFFYYSLIDVDLDNRRDALESAIKRAKEMFPGRHTVVFLDTITDFLIDLNSTKEALEFVTYLNRLVNNENSTVIGLIHLNEKGLSAGFSTGAIGTHLRRKGSNAITINKVSDNQYSIDIAKVRVTGTPKKLYVKYNPDLRMLTLLDESELQTGYKAKPNELKEYLIDLLSAGNVSKQEMLFNVEERFGIKDERTLQNRIDKINQNDMFLNIEKVTSNNNKSFYTLKKIYENAEVI